MPSLSNQNWQNPEKWQTQKMIAFSKFFFKKKMAVTVCCWTKHKLVHFVFSLEKECKVKKMQMNSLISNISIKSRKKEILQLQLFSCKLVYFDHPKVVPDAAGRRQNHISPWSSYKGQSFDDSLMPSKCVQKKYWYCKDRVWFRK